MKRLTGYAKFQDRIVFDEDVYQLVKRHSRLIDRLNPKKMIEMTWAAFDLLAGSIEKPENVSENWTFYGKHGPLWRRG